MKLNPYRLSLSQGCSDHYGGQERENLSSVKELETVKISKPLETLEIVEIKLT